MLKFDSRWAFFSGLPYSACKPVASLKQSSRWAFFRGSSRVEGLKLNSRWAFPLRDKRLKFNSRWAFLPGLTYRLASLWGAWRSTPGELFSGAVPGSKAWRSTPGELFFSGSPSGLKDLQITPEELFTGFYYRGLSL
jgi:hypothetical protein